MDNALRAQERAHLAIAIVALTATGTPQRAQATEFAPQGPAKQGA